jgi:hypothetical protein
MLRHKRTYTLDVGDVGSWIDREPEAGLPIQVWEGWYLILGAGFLMFGILAHFGINLPGEHGDGKWPMALGGITVLVTGPWIWLRLAKWRLVPEAKLHERLRLDAQALETAIREHDVRPRMIINDTRYYAPADFSDARILVRASAAPPVEEETLLRGATGQSQIADTHLLHPVNSPPQSSSVASVTAAAEQELPVEIVRREG